MVADREMYAKFYESLEKDAKEADDILLCVLINSEGDVIRRNDPTYTGYRYCMLVIESYYKKRIFEAKTFKHEVELLKNESPILLKGSNKQLVKENLSPFTDRVIFESDFAFSELKIEDWASQGDSRLGFSKTYFIIEPAVFSFLMYYDIYKEDEIKQLEKETLSYVKKLGKQ